MQRAGVEAAAARERPVGMGRRRRQRGRGREGEAPDHAMPVRNAPPAMAIAAPAIRTVTRPAGHLPICPIAMPLRCKSPVATTNPTA